MQARHGRFTLFFLLAALPVGAAHAQQPPGETPPAPPPPEVTADGPTLSERLDALFGATRGLTADDVARAAARTSHDVAAQEAEVDAQQRSVDQAGVGWFPRLTVQGRYRHDNYFTPPSLGILATPMPGTPVTPVPGIPAPGGLLPASTQYIAVPLSFPVIENSYAFQATVAVPISDYFLRVSQAYNAASHSARAARYTEDATRRMAALGARNAYYQWVRAQLQAIVAEQALAQSEGHLADARRSFEVGAASAADVARVQSQRADTELLLARAQNFSMTAEEQLRTLMHVHDAHFVVGEDVREDLPAPEHADQLEALYAEALANRPELVAIGENASALEDQASLARAAAIPRLDGYADVLVANPNPRYFPPSQETNTTWDVGLSLSWSPNDLGTSLAASGGIDARRTEVQEQRAALRDRLRTEVVQAYAALREANVAARTTAEGLTAAEESYRVRRALYRNGRATTIELTDAEVDLTRARLTALDARVALRLARAALLHAVGRDRTE